MRSAPAGRRILQSLVLAAFVPLHGVSAQTAYPEVEVRQILGSGVGTWSNSARVSLDRDAFVVVFELGADGRARIIYPESPRENGFMRASRNWYVPLPSVDAMFIQATTMRTPTVVAFASDLAPDLSEFTDEGRHWDYMFSIKDGVSRETTLRDLATLIFGDAEMPYSVSESRIAPTLPPSAQSALRTCGYQPGAYGTASYYEFLWSMFGPFYGWGYGANSTAFNAVTFAPWSTSNFVNYYSFASASSAFTRFASTGLWTRYGMTCDPLRQLLATHVVLLPERNGPGTPADSLMPRDSLKRGPHGRVGDVGIVPATEAARLERAGAVKLAASELEVAVGSLTRQSNEEMVQRQEIASLLAQLRVMRALGKDNIDARDLQAIRTFGTVERKGFGSGFNKSIGRASTSTASGSSTAGSSGSGSSSSTGSSSSAGSEGSAGSSGRATETRGGTGRGGTGRPPFLQ